MIASLQYLRAVAAMMVVAFHAFDKLAAMDHTSKAGGFTVGLAGVDIFFVISGFIIFVTGERADATPAGFMRKRLIRIVPLYWVLTVLVAVIAIAKPDLMSTTVFNFPHFAASLLFVPWPHPQIDAQLPLLIPGWTLNYEMAFYVLFAASLILPRSLRLGAMLGVLAALALIGLAVPESGPLGFYTDPIILEFAAGLVIAKFWVEGFTLDRRIALAAMLAGFVLLYAGAGTSLPRIVGSGLPAALIVAGALFSESRVRLRPIRPLAKLGDASYSLYLSHVMVLPVLAKVWTAAGLDGRNAAAFIVLVLVVSAVVGVALYEIVERPLLNWLNQKQPSRASPQPVRPAHAAAHSGKAAGYVESL